MNGRRATMVVFGFAMLIGLASSRTANGQGAIAYVPQIGSINDGASLNVTPVVSADRRYVRLVNIQPVFNQVDGFTTFTIPGAVAGGGGFGGGGFGGLGGGLGGGGGAGGGAGGFPSVGLGNNRMMGLQGFQDPNPLGSFTAFAQTAEPQKVARSKTVKGKKATTTKKKTR